MKSLILIPAFFLSGCFHQTITNEDIKNANIICDKHGSYVVDMTARFDGVELVTCSDMMQYFIRHESLK